MTHFTIDDESNVPVVSRSTSGLNSADEFCSAVIDNVETVNRILNDDARQQYIDRNQELLKDQARNFYTGVISSVDPTLDIEFEFSS